MTTKTLLTAAMLFLAPAAFAQETAAEIEALLNAGDDMMRGTSSIAQMEMQVKTDRYERTMRMTTWTEGEDKTLIRIDAPAKDAGTATLKVEDNLWNYLPKIDRTMKVPAGMMSGAWMGSHVSNDDLVKESRLADDYTWEVNSRPTDGVGSWVITLVPKPDTAIVWGKVVTTIRADKLLDKVEYYDEDGTLMRVMDFDQFKEIGGRTIPAVMTVSPQDKPGEFTKITYLDIQFDVPIEGRTFTLQALKE